MGVRQVPVVENDTRFDLNVSVFRTVAGYFWIVWGNITGPQERELTEAMKGFVTECYKRRTALLTCATNELSKDGLTTLEHLTAFIGSV